MIVCQDHSQQDLVQKENMHMYVYIIVTNYHCSLS